MRLLGELKDREQATVFSSYLLVKGIESHFDRDEGDPCEVWVKDEDQFKEAYADFQEFLENPGDQKYSSSVRQAKSIAKEAEKKRQQIQKRIVKVQNNSMSRRPTLTLLLMAICGLVALASEFGEVPRDHSVNQALQFVSVPAPDGQAIKASSGDPDGIDVRSVSIRRGEIWRVVTPIFIHYGIMHILFNLYMFFQFGSLIENRYGTLKFGLICLASAALSNLAQGFVPYEIGGSPPGLTNGTMITSFGGMSGVVYGLFGFVWMKSIFDRKFGFKIPQSTVIILIAWLFLCMLPDGMAPVRSVANWAHGIGLLVGMAIGYLSSLK